jgi:hypothetical protein
MILRFSKGVWFISIVGVLAALLFAYANLPEKVLISQQGADFLYVDREGFFYGSLAIVAIVNSLVFILSAVFNKDIPLRTWFNGLISVLNIFFVVSFLLINAINSTERFELERTAFLIYGSIILIAVWAISWPIYLLVRKFWIKPAT